MSNLKEFILKLMASVQAEDGQSLVEYGLIIVLVSVVAIAGLQLIGTNVLGVFNSIGGTLGGA